MSYVPFSPKQRRAMTWWMPGNPDRGYEAIVCDGAVRSGKTMAMGLGFFLWAQAVFTGRRFALCGKTIGALRRNVLAELLPRLEELGAQIQERRSENRLTVSLGGHTNDFYLFGGRDEAAAGMIQGMTLAGVLMDEVALMPRSFVEQACARCSVTGSRLWFNCNPAGPNHWFYREWILGAGDRNALHLHFCMEDNPSLSPEIRQRYERLYTASSTGGSCWDSGARPRGGSTISSSRRWRCCPRRAGAKSGTSPATTEPSTPCPWDCGGCKRESGTG